MRLGTKGGSEERAEAGSGLHGGLCVVEGGVDGCRYWVEEEGMGVGENGALL